MPVAAKVTTGFKISKLLRFFVGLPTELTVVTARSKKGPDGTDRPQDESAVTQGDDGDDRAKDKHDNGAGNAAVQKS